MTSYNRGHETVFTSAIHNGIFEIVNGTMKYNGKALSQIPTELFLKKTECHLKHYRFCKDFWWPIIQQRATFHTDNAFELLLNSLFCSGFLNNKDRLQVAETQLEQLYFLRNKKIDIVLKSAKGQLDA